MSIPFEELIKPVGMNNFITKYKGKRHFVIKSDIGKRYLYQEIIKIIKVIKNKKNRKIYEILKEF